MFDSGNRNSSNITVYNNASGLQVREESIFFQIFSGFLGSLAVLGNLTAILAIISQSQKLLGHINSLLISPYQTVSRDAYAFYLLLF